MGFARHGRRVRSSTDSGFVSLTEYSYTHESAVSADPSSLPHNLSLE